MGTGRTVDVIYGCHSNFQRTKQDKIVSNINFLSISETSARNVLVYLLYEEREDSDLHLTLSNFVLMRESFYGYTLINEPAGGFLWYFVYLHATFTELQNIMLPHKISGLLGNIS